MLKVTVIFSLLMFSKAFNIFLVRTLAQVFRAGLLKVNDAELLEEKKSYLNYPSKGQDLAYLS